MGGPTPDISRPAKPGRLDGVVMQQTVTLRSRWTEILPSAATPSERRARWATWLRAARAAGAGDQAREWADGRECCGDCAHRRGGWCALQGLPCSVNPVLTIRHNMPGMACMGMGRQERPPVQMMLNLLHNAGIHRPRSGPVE